MRDRRTCCTVHQRTNRHARFLFISLISFSCTVDVWRYIKYRFFKKQSTKAKFCLPPRATVAVAAVAKSDVKFSVCQLAADEFLCGRTNISLTEWLTVVVTSFSAHTPTPASFTLQSVCVCRRGDENHHHRIIIDSDNSNWRQRLLLLLLPV